MHLRRYNKKHFFSQVVNNNNNNKTKTKNVSDLLPIIGIHCFVKLARIQILHQKPGFESGLQADENALKRLILFIDIFGTWRRTQARLIASHCNHLLAANMISR